MNEMKRRLTLYVTRFGDLYYLLVTNIALR